MQDGIIMGTGNSRYLKSISGFLAMYPTYEAFAQALVAGTLPIDLSGKNPDGWAQQGTPLNKANLLTDATAAIAGLGSEASKVVAAYIGVYGTRGGEITLPTVWANLGIILEGASPGEAAGPPTPELWGQTLAEVQIAGGGGGIPVPGRPGADGQTGRGD